MLNATKTAACISFENLLVLQTLIFLPLSFVPSTDSLYFQICDIKSLHFSLLDFWNKWLILVLKSKIECKIERRINFTLQKSRSKKYGYLQLISWICSLSNAWNFIFILKSRFYLHFHKNVYANMCLMFLCFCKMLK